MEKLENNLFFLAGLFSTWMAVMISINGVNFAIFNFILVAIIIIEVLKNKAVYLNQKSLIIFSILSIFSTIGSKIFINDLWFSSSLRATLKFVIIVIPFLLFIKNETLLEKRKYFMKGLYFSVIFQLLWEFLEIIIWSTSEISLNKMIFGDFFKFDIGRNWLFWSDGRMRPTGLSWEPANLSLSLIIGYVLSKNKLLKSSFALGIILSTSRIGIGTFAILLAIDIFKWIKGIQKKRGNINVAKIIPIVCIILVFLLLTVSIISNVEFFDYIYKNVESTIYTIVHISKNPSANRHLEYYFRLPELYGYLNIFQILFGVGVTCAGYPYAEFLDIYSTNEVWTPETDYLSILIGNGILGFAFYFYWLSKIIKKNLKNYKFMQIILAILMIITMAQFYRGWVTFLLIFFGTTNSNESKDLIEEME